MCEKFIKYMYLGYSKDEMEKYHDELDKSNIKILKNICMSYLFMSIIVSAFYSYIDYEYNRVSICLFYGTVSGVFFLISRYVCKNIDEINTICINLLISFATFTSYTYGIYLGTFACSKSYSVTIIWMFMLMQIVFNISPIYNLMSIVPSVVIFIFCSVMTKEAIYAAYDILHTIIVVSIGLFMSWVKSKLKVDCIATSNKIKVNNEELYRESIIDHLTGLYNRRYIFKKLYDMQDEFLINDEEISCLIIDVDNFKSYNDFYGHPCGDILLNKLGQAFKKFAEEYDINIGRIGGEEFLAVWKNKSLEDSKIIADVLRDTIIKLNLKHEKSDVMDIVTISQGLYAGSCKKSRGEIDYVYNMADTGLYEAKNRGKNCISIVTE